MSERAASRAPQPASADGGRQQLLTIGELLAQLAPEFSDVTHSKVRFLEDRGLVSPQRTPSGYRKFTPADVERLRTVLRLQRDQYMPLRVIREHLAAQDASADGGAGAAAGTHQDDTPVDDDPPSPSTGSPPSTASTASVETSEDPPAASSVTRGGGGADRREPVSRSEVLEQAGGSLALLEALEDHGLLPRESAGRYPRSALDLVRAAVVLGEHGIEPRHLRALRTAVGAEAALVDQVVSPLRRARPGERPERADERADDAERVALELVTSLLSLHAAALGCALDEVAPLS
ncbi:MerR family transcriptional regulator [Quadrisphaera setariae]|uniref:MerR family transcriptional regulator n=1 Tax=Quadrisphaera setariae TaxID=2593304 RepID=A0A5C8ZIH9_9ACTN|nr:MerR family transcriptional regulator [Quadrisphaera setariae]TXR56680.1 MerR family transcriptional regulator [Quadrisphaera setariae]